MWKLISPMLAVALVLPAVSVQAQWLGPSWETNIVLTQQDLDMMHATVDRQVHGRSVGTVGKWNNPASGNTGTITLIKRLAIGGRDCEEIEYMIATTRHREHQPEHYHFTSCKQPDGTWKLS